MANSTWFQTTNKILELKGQLQISSADNFNNPITGLTRIQSQTRAFVDLCDRLLNVKRNNRDTSQEFALTTQVGNPDILSTYTYQLDASISIESIRYWSFFNTTPQSDDAGSTTSISAQGIYNMPYREFRRRWPDFTSIPLSPPVLWVIMPKSLMQGGVGIVNDTILFYPIPDAVYTIQYQAKTNAVPLQLDTDPILWSPQYEHVLWTWAGAWLEDALGEGKGQMAQYYAERALSEYLFWAAGPDEERKAIRTGMNIYGPMRGRRVNQWSTTPNVG